jgi:hypothetical protein
MVEGKHNRVKVLKRRAYGYRNDRNFMLRILNLIHTKECRPRLKPPLTPFHTSGMLAATRSLGIVGVRFLGAEEQPHVSM